MLVELPFISSSLAMNESNDDVSELFTPRVVAPFSSPSLAMEETEDDVGELTTPCTSQSSSHKASPFFEYDLTRITQAQQLISQSSFLPEAIRLFFQRSAQMYDRTQFLDLLTPAGEERFFSNLMPVPNENNTEESQLAPISLGVMENCEDMDPEEIEALRELEMQVQMSMQTARARASQERERYLRGLYTPHIENINHEIETKGPLNHQLFDSFFAHLLGVGKLWWVMKEKGFDIVVEEQEKYVYDRQDVIHLLQNLEGIGFVNNFTAGSLSCIEQFYNPSNQLQRFHENNKEVVTQLVIAGGHLGYGEIQSISKYRNALTIDLSPLELPDIIEDINDTELLEGLVRSYEGKLNFIIDTSCCDFVFDPDTTAPYLLRLLRPGGRLISRRPYGLEIIDSSLADIYVKKYNLKPIFSDRYDSIVALEKLEGEL